jgi:hypothetical protein
LFPTPGTRSWEHEATGTLVVTTAGGQLVWVQLFSALAAATVHVATGTLNASLLTQVVVVQPLVPSPTAAVQDEAGTLIELFVAQSVAT